MSSLEDALLILISNPLDVFEETCRLLIKIADNVLKNPFNVKLRTLQKENQTVKNKILSVRGGLECLISMGFNEKDDTFTLPSNASLKQLEDLKSGINKIQGNPSQVTHNGGSDTKQNIDKSGAIPKQVTPKKEAIIEKNTETFINVKLPPVTHLFTNPFLQEIETHFHEVQKYEHSHLQERARNVMPIHRLETKAQERLRTFNEHIKKEKLPDPDVSLQDMLILELLDWFKIEFFTWVDSPDCQSCGEKTTYKHMATDKNELQFTDRVEMYICSNCNTLTPFPRYNDPNILLETRKGRCGEWANVFTLMCRTMGWDSRYVHDETDHVWTEVYSHCQKRWLHCDPCENILDKPLIYESGWKKKLTYIIAYSIDEVQDVTWRYSNQHKTILTRRNLCSEIELVNALVKLRDNRQKNLAKSRKDYLRKRLLFELVELMVEKKPSEGDMDGRSSGSLTWRISRGETKDNNTSYTWYINESDVNCENISFVYSSSQNAYKKIKNDTELVSEIQSWENGTFHNSNVFRKIENDWKMAYLCRKENTTNGNISWKFDTTQVKKVFHSIKLRFLQNTFENGEIVITITNNKYSITVPAGQSNYETDKCSGSSSVVISAQLKGGIGDVAWQHAQIFRQSLDSAEFPFQVTVTFKDPVNSCD